MLGLVGFNKGPDISTYLMDLDRNTLPETNSSHLKMDGWNTSFLLGWSIFRCEMLVSGRVSVLQILTLHSRISDVRDASGQGQVLGIRGLVVQGI